MGVTQREGREGRKGTLWPSVPLLALQRACPRTEGKEVTGGVGALLVGQDNTELRQILKCLDLNGTLALVRYL